MNILTTLFQIVVKIPDKKLQIVFQIFEIKLHAACNAVDIAVVIAFQTGDF
ncbi:hypothetical protein KSD64_09620 [Staphylococcus aureus]|nr:hypothetical protein [Staphylococcus aureus]MBU8246659.1 hypothetical protein [Staphylococcus aureus]MBU8252332.1 hypothetical protein [Staphylococcus aureus]